MPPYNHEHHHENPAVQDAVIIIDPYSTGCLVAKAMAERGLALVSVWSTGLAEKLKTHVPKAVGKLHYLARLEQAPTLAETAQRCRESVPHGASIVACLAGGETGVPLADALSEYMGLRTNGTAILDRRDKMLQQQLIKKAGLRSIREVCGRQFSDVEDFLRRERYPVVLKPNESAGSDGVKLCETFEEAKEHFHQLLDSETVCGTACDAVLCQEFLRGKEYVVDHVSCDGHHKTMMVWQYDKRPANGAGFVYYGCLPTDRESPEAKLLIPYTRGVLDAIGIENGPTHGEIIISEDDGQPCLVEMNCRANGGNGDWHPLAKALTGSYSQIEAAVDAYIDPKGFFAKYPDKPPSPLKVSGQEVQLVCYKHGTVKSMPGYAAIKTLPSFTQLEPTVQVGQKVVPTVDLITNVGDLVLMNEDEEQLHKDVSHIRWLENENQLFELE